MIDGRHGGEEEKKKQRGGPGERKKKTKRRQARLPSACSAQRERLKSRCNTKNVG